MRTAPAEKYGAELDELSTKFPELDGLLADMTEDQGGVVRDERTVLMERVYQSPIPLQGGTCMPCRGLRLICNLNPENTYPVRVWEATR